MDAEDTELILALWSLPRYLFLPSGLLIHALYNVSPTRGRIFIYFADSFTPRD